MTIDTSHEALAKMRAEYPSPEHSHVLALIDALEEARARIKHLEEQLDAVVEFIGEETI